MLSYTILVKTLYFFEILAFVLVFRVLLKGKRETAIVSLFYILLITVLVETYGFIEELIVEDIKNINNQLIFNLANYIVFILWYYVYLQLLPKYKYLIYTFFISYIVVVVVEAKFFVDHTLQAQVMPFVMAGISLCVLVLLYFIEILKSDNPRVLMINLFFWINGGLMFYYVVNIPFKLVQNYHAVTLSTYGKYFFLSQIAFSNLMYIFFCIGLYKYGKEDLGQ